MASLTGKRRLPGGTQAKRQLSICTNLTIFYVRTSKHVAAGSGQLAYLGGSQLVRSDKNVILSPVPQILNYVSFIPSFLCTLTHVETLTGAYPQPMLFRS